MIPLALVTGFLGSGKTTFLRRVIERRPAPRLVYVVNEFSRADVDGRLLETDGADYLPLPGGSIFCACLTGEFLRVMRGLPERFPGVEGVIVEASGIADPRVARRMLRETGLDALYRLDSIVAVVDPGSFPTLMHTLPNIVAQIEACDTAILNKTDLFDEAALATVEELLLGIRPGLDIRRAVRCDVDIDLFEGAREARALDGAYAACADPNYARLLVTPPGAVDVARLEAAVHAIRDDLYRVKGFVNTEDGVRYLDYSATGWQSAPASGAPDPQLVFIVRGVARERARALVDDIRRGAFAPGPR